MFSLQASPESDGEKDRKGRDKDKDKENDKSRGKNRSESKQKSPKRKAPKEEVRLHLNSWISCLVFDFSLSQKSRLAGWLLFVSLSGRMGHVRQWTEWRRAGEEEKNSFGAVRCTLDVVCLCPSTSRCKTCIPRNVWMIIHAVHWCCAWTTLISLQRTRSLIIGNHLHLSL